MQIVGNRIILIGGTDAGGIEIVPDGHGGYVIKRIPGWNPEQMLDVGAAAKSLAAGAAIKNTHVSSALVNLAANFVHGEIEKHVGSQAAGHTTVVIVQG